MPNDNRTPAGTLRDGVLTLRIEARLASWHPDGDDAPGAIVPAFAEAGGPARIPGPLIRVPAGTEVVVVLRNRLDGATLDVHGLGERIALASPPVPEPVRLRPGETRTVRFRLSAPGTYYYWGTTTGRAFSYRIAEDAQLNGAIVVDPAGGRADDRIFVMSMWADTVARAFTDRKRLLAVFNGRSWPNVERMRYTVGDSVRWRVINASADAHPMHLHGFYFRIDGRGNGLTDTLYLESTAQRMFTEVARIGGTFDMTWVPERPGNWLFHCHIAEHFGRRGPLGAAPAAQPMAGHAGANHATEGMGGLVTGITVLPRPSTATSSAQSRDESRRRIRLLVRRNAGGSDATPYFGFSVQEGAASPAPPDSGLRFGAPLILTRGEPVRITVVNQLREPTAVHWHGIELESYFDGVPDFSGEGRRLAPAIAPGDSFEVRFTPPRAGTFIYHTHFNEERQLLAGLAGPLIVLEPGERYDPSTDHVVMLGSPTRLADQQRAVLVSGVTNPPLALRANVRHRLRVINITLRRPVLRLDLMRDSLPEAWSLIAKDAITLPRPIESPGGARRTVGLGETLDFEVTPSTPGDLRLDVRIGGQLPPHTLLGSIGIRVVP
ncbi:MAG TPA: multicopper oxidase domain-containing protein [Gemmatimonadaceae bacterium]|nr:multicopper oxidase domain-containing protein [Gemmatimonadaceae bacterium]